MATDVALSTDLVGSLRALLDRGAGRIEDCAGSAPASVDAGDLTAMLCSMLARVTDNAAATSEAITALGGQVGEASTAFWETDTAVAGAYPGAPGAR